MRDLDEYIEEIITRTKGVMTKEKIDFKDALKVVETAINYRELEIIEQKLDCIGDSIDRIG